MKRLVATWCLFLLTVAVLPVAAAPPAPALTSISTLRVPNSGIQPQVAVDDQQRVHLIYFAGNARHGDLFYVVGRGNGKFSQPLRVNSQPGSAIAMGNIRGAQLAIGRGGRAIVAWMGSDLATPKAPGEASPMLVTRLADSGSEFEPQRNVIAEHAGLDGGGSVAADERGNVYVVWHGNGSDSNEEADRRVWVAHSADEGQSFLPEIVASTSHSGACACCGLKAMAGRDGKLAILYRTASEEVHRDMVLLTSAPAAKSFAATRLQPWKIGHCVMSSAALADTPRGMLAAWETEEQVYFAAIDSSGKPGPLRSAPGKAGKRKHPAIAVNGRSEILLVWTESMGWEKGGAVAWQLFDAQQQPVEAGRGRLDGVPVWSLVATFAKPDGNFVVVY